MDVGFRLRALDGRSIQRHAFRVVGQELLGDLDTGEFEYSKPLNPLTRNPQV